MVDYRVDCITKPGNHFDPNTRIQGLGGASPENWYGTEDQVIASIRAGNTFYVHRPPATRVEVEIAYRNLTAYLKTVPDGIPYDNLLSLPECAR
jgi:hypothetical protein